MSIKGELGEHRTLLLGQGVSLLLLCTYHSLPRPSLSIAKISILAATGPTAKAVILLLLFSVIIIMGAEIKVDLRLTKGLRLTNLSVD